MAQSKELSYKLSFSTRGGSRADFATAELLPIQAPPEPIGQQRTEVRSLLPLGAPDTVLQGGLAMDELRELAPVSFLHSGAALGFALALSSLQSAPRGA